MSVEIGKTWVTTSHSDLSDAFRAVLQQFTDRLDPDMMHIRKRRHPEGLAEQTHEIAFAQMDGLCEHLDGERLRIMLLDIVDDRRKDAKRSADCRNA